jgi:hypothetical protein
MCVFFILSRPVAAFQSFRMPALQNCRRSCRPKQAHFIAFIVAFRFQTSEPYYAVASCLFVERRFMVYTVRVKFSWCGWSIFKAFVTLSYLLLTFFIYCFFLSVLRSNFLVTLFLQPCRGGDSHLSLNGPSSIPGQIIIHWISEVGFGLSYV